MIQTFSIIIMGKACFHLKAASSTATHSFRDLDHSCVLSESTFSLMVEIRQNSKLCITMDSDACREWAIALSI